MRSISVDVDIDDIVCSMSKYDKQEMLEELVNELDKDSIKNILKGIKDEDKKSIVNNFLFNDRMTFLEIEFTNNIVNLQRNYLKLSNEDQKIIEDISKKY